MENESGCLSALLFIVIVIMAVFMVTKMDTKNVSIGDDKTITTMTTDTGEGGNADKNAVSPPKKGETKFVRTIYGLKFRSSDGSGKIIGYINQGEILEVLKKDPHNPNRLIVLNQNGDKGSVWNRYLVEIKNKEPDKPTGEINPPETNPPKEEEAPETTNPPETNPPKEEEAPETTNPTETNPPKEEEAPETTNPPETNPPKEEEAPETT